MQVDSFIAIGDSFTEGVGDNLDTGRVRGWADFVAIALARTSRTPVRYANLAVRGKKLTPILDEQIETAIRQHPTVISLNGGGNDILRPRVSIDSIADALISASARIVESGSNVLLVSGANPSGHMPLGGLVRSRGDKLDQAVLARLPLASVTYVDNWVDNTLGDLRYWSADRIHLNTLGHLRVAHNVLTELNVPVPKQWELVLDAATENTDRQRMDLHYYRTYVLPWLGRRLTGRSSGDGRHAKIETLALVDLTLDNDIIAP